MFNRKSSISRNDLISHPYSWLLIITAFLTALYTVFKHLKRPKAITEKMSETIAKPELLEATKQLRNKNELIKPLSSSAKAMATLTPKASEVKKPNTDIKSSAEPSSSAGLSSNRRTVLTPATIKKEVLKPQEKPKTLAIKEKILNRKAEKLAEKGIAQAARLKEKEEHAAAMAKWREEKAKRKFTAEVAINEKLLREANLTKEQDPRLSKWRKNNAAKHTTTAVTSGYWAPPVKIVSNETLLSLKNHAIYLASFAYSINPESPLTILSKTLGFLYNFHRYNLFRRFILAYTEQADTSAELRTMMVHLTNKIAVTQQLISETQLQLNHFIYKDVVNLVQKRSRFPVSSKTDEKIKELKSLTSPIRTEASLQSLPLYQSLYTLRDQIDLEAKILPEDLYSWMKKTIIPLLNTLSLDKEANLDAIKWVIIILGEHCDRAERNELLHFFSIIETDRKVALKNVKEFMKACRDIRNDLAHEISDVSIEKINDLMDKTRLITTELLDYNIDLDIINPFNTIETSEKLEI